MSMASFISDTAVDKFKSVLKIMWIVNFGIETIMWTTIFYTIVD